MIQPISQFSSNYYRQTFKASSNRTSLNNIKQESKRIKTQPSVDYITFLQPNNLEIKKDNEHYIMHIAPDGISTLKLPITAKKH